MAEVYFISGKCKWAKLFKPDTKYDENGIYSIVLYPDADGWETFKRSGLNVRPKEDEDGKFITLRRKKVVNFGKGDQDIGGPEENMANALAGVFLKKFCKEYPELEEIVYGK
jgi:hypothetical protein